CNRLSSLSCVAYTIPLPDAHRIPGHAYEYWPGSDEQWERDCEVTPRFGGRYRLHHSLEHAVHRLGLWELECGRLGRSFPPEKWPARKSTRLNSSHVKLSYAVLCLK